MKTEENPIPVKVKRVGFFTRLEEFIKEESAANGWAYATLQVWHTFTNHMQGFNPKATFETFIDPMWSFMNETVDRVPMSDWVYTDKPNYRGFKARSVVGGYFIKLLK